MANRISINDFKFQYAGNGYYLIQYTSPRTGKSWVIKTDKLNIIDTFCVNTPKQKDLKALKRLCKSGITNSYII